VMQPSIHPGRTPVAGTPTFPEAGITAAVMVNDTEVRNFLLTHGPDGVTTDPDGSWIAELDGWGEPGSADYAHAFETFFYGLQQHDGALTITRPPVGDVYGTTPILMEITCDSSGVADAFLVRVQLLGGAQVCSSAEELHHLASGTGADAALDAVHTVAGMASEAVWQFSRSAAALYEALSAAPLSDRGSR
jgi:hypothetical protein